MALLYESKKMLQQKIKLIILALSHIFITDCVSIINTPIVILCTGALIPQKFEERKNEYFTVLNILHQQPLPVFFVESCLPQGPTYLDDYCNNVFYAHSNNAQLRNKGVNEGRSMLLALQHFCFTDETIIIKVTGRYPFKDFSFINLILNNPSYDAFIKYDEHGQVYTGCFAMRCKHMKEMLSKLNFIKMEKNMINIEAEVARYIQHNIPKNNIYRVSTLGITARFFGTGDRLDIVDL